MNFTEAIDELFEVTRALKAANDSRDYRTMYEWRSLHSRVVEAALALLDATPARATSATNGQTTTVSPPPQTVSESESGAS